MRYIIGMEASRFSFLAESEKLTQEDKRMYRALVEVNNGLFTMSESVLVSSLQTLTKLLEKHYGVKVLVLIDEYDVPLDKAFQYGYYDKMILLIRNLFSNVLKSNNSLFFAVLTGCLRISKESIFTGLNNLKIFSITNVAFDECFGFTDDEVKDLLEYYNLSEHYPSIREWYDGYQFGNVSVYCPWDVISHCDALCADPDAYPEGYSDILVEVPESRTGIVIELKYAEHDKLDAACAEALKQIEDKKYETQLAEDGMQTILRYGIACYRKHCKVMRG